MTASLDLIQVQVRVPRQLVKRVRKKLLDLETAERRVTVQEILFSPVVEALEAVIGSGGSTIVRGLHGNNHPTSSAPSVDISEKLSPRRRRALQKTNGKA